MGERFLEFLRYLLRGGLWYVLALFNGYVLCRLTVPFLSVRKRWWQGILLLLFAGSSGMVIWVGDPNLLYTLPIFFGGVFSVHAGKPDRKAHYVSGVFLPGDVGVCPAGHLSGRPGQL